MIHRVLPVLVLAAPVWAQFSQLATTNDAQQLYFTSALRLSPTSVATPEQRIFRFGSSGVALFAERGSLAPVNTGGGSSDGMTAPQVSGDGTLVGLTAHDICPSGGSCTPSQAEGLLRGAISADLGPGALQLSRNGRWVVLHQQNFTPPSTLTQTASLIDLQTNQSVPIPPPASDTWMVTSSGAVFVEQPLTSGVVQGFQFGIWQQGKFSPVTLANQYPIHPNALSDDGSTLVFTQLNPSPSGPSLVAHNLSTGTEMTIYTAPNATSLPNVLGLTNNGQQVLFSVWVNQAAGPAFLWSATSGVSAPISLDAGELATSGALGGSGNSGYLATTEGRIVKFLVASIASYTDTVIPVTPYISNSLILFSPGSMVQLQGTLPPSVDQLSGHILLGGNPLPILYADPTQIRAQVPWEQKTGQTALTVNIPPNTSPFQQDDLVEVLPFALNIEFADPGQTTILGLKLVKGDFSGLVTAQPAPGDIIVAYFTGLGAVKGTPQTDVPTPTTPLFPTIGQLTCQFSPGQSPMKTLFVGLAPLMIGIYQATFQLPPDAGQAPITGLQCTFQSPDGEGSFGIFQGTPPTPSFISRSTKLATPLDRLPSP